MHNLPFDLNKMDYKAVSKLKRKKLLVYSVVPVALVFLLAMWFILPQLLTHKAIGDYKQGNYKGARRWLAPLTWSSPEPFVAAFNSGTADTKLAKYDRAEKELTRAVAIAPKEKVCMAAQNLVFSIKDHAGTYKEKSKEATELLTKAKLVVDNHQDCFKGAASSGGGGGASSAAQSQSPSDAQQQQLEQKEQEGRDRKSKYASEEKYDPNNPELKPW